MKFTRHRFVQILCGCALALVPAPAVFAQSPAPASAGNGSHDFDFNFGVWKTQISRLTHPLTGSRDAIALTGTVTVRPVWGGRAALEEIEADGPNGHWEGMTLFLYNPKAQQWSQSFFDSSDPAPSPPLIGSFHEGQGGLYAQDTFQGRSILVRGTWSNITADAHHYEEAYSDDGGKSWETVFSASLTRIRS
jgi:hypothetical protein